MSNESTAGVFDAAGIDPLSVEGDLESSSIIPGAIVPDEPKAKAKKVKVRKTKPVKERSRRKTNKSPEGAETGSMTSVEGWEPTKSSFDLLGGEYLLLSRRRLVLIASVGALIVFVIAMLLRVGATFAALQSENSALTQARADQVQLTADYAAIVGTTGATLEQILNHVQNKGRSIVNLTSNEAPLPTLIAVLQSAPVGTTITSVDLSGGEGDGAVNTGAGGPPQWQMRVTATVSEQTLIPGLVEAVKAVPGVTAVEASWGGSEGQGTVTLTITASASNQQSDELAARFGIESAVTAAETDQTGTGTTGSTDTPEAAE